MDMRLELVSVPVSDPDASIAFYRDKAGFVLDHDHKVSDDIRFVQLTPPGSACSIALGKGVSQKEPGSVEGLQVVVDDIEEAKATLEARRRPCRRRAGLPVGPVRLLLRPRRQRLGGPADRAPALSAPVVCHSAIAL